MQSTSIITCENPRREPNVLKIALSHFKIKGLFGFMPKHALPKSWLAHIFWLLFGSTPKHWLAQLARLSSVLFAPMYGRDEGAGMLRQKISVVTLVVDWWALRACGRICRIFWLLNYHLHFLLNKKCGPLRDEHQLIKICMQHCTQIGTSNY